MHAAIRFAAAVLVAAAPSLAGPPVTLESLLHEMVDREAIARFPDPAYTCKQFSSYDRASKTPDDPKTWFANGDASQYLRTEEVAAEGGKVRKEWVMADMDGPGAIVRFWSANPKGTVRVYLDGGAAPAIEAPMAGLLGGKWKIGKPLSEECSRGWNLYLPIPYAKHCKVTSDADGFYYQINYRTYAGGTAVETFDLQSLTEPVLAAATKSLGAELPGCEVPNPTASLAPGESRTFDGMPGPAAITSLGLRIGPGDAEQMLRSLVISAEFDGEKTVWCPAGDFFGSGVGMNAYRDWYCEVGRDGTLRAAFVMPYRKSGKVVLTNLGKSPVAFGMNLCTKGTPWTDRSMHFHAAWHYEYPIHAYGGRGTMDWNYVDIAGKGVYVGDTLAVMNPVPEWWGEGDEKIYVDGEKFPSHFGTGTEDYYGYAWCWPAPFQHPFHAQTRSDGRQHHDNNWGHTTVTRVRSLDAIPFTKGLKFDMEVWHWKECDEAYAATTYFYALPGATTNRKPQAEDAAKPVPQPPPLPPPFKVKVDGAATLECEDLKVVGQTPGITVTGQDMYGFKAGVWSGESHLWVQAQKIGDFVELTVPTGDGPGGKEPVKLTVYATKSWDYGAVRFSVNGAQTGPGIDLFSGQQGRVQSTGPIELGTFEPVDGRLVLRAEVVGSNPKSLGTKTYFGLDCVVVAPVGAK